MVRKYTLTLMALLAVLTACDAGGRQAEAPATGGPTTEETPAADAPDDAPADAPADGYPRPCAGADLTATIAPGESGGPTEWSSAIVVTSTAAEPCVLEGTSRVAFRTGGSGAPLEINQVTDGSVVPSPVAVAPGEQAAMSVAYGTSHDDPVPGDCLTDGVYAEVELPGNLDIVEAWFPDRELGLPPVCGAVTTGAWEEGGAPGVSPN